MAPKRKRNGKPAETSDPHQGAGPSNAETSKISDQKQATTSSGIHCGLPGNQFQIIVTVFVLLRAINLFPKKSFQLRMERTDAGSFDDISVKVGDAEVFIQVKHDTNCTNVTEGMLLAGTEKGTEKNDFGLLKYFKSYRKIKECCVLLTNKPIAKKVEAHLEKIKVCDDLKLFADLFEETGTHYCIKKDSDCITEIRNVTSEPFENHADQEKLEELDKINREINSFCNHFILSVKHPASTSLRIKIQKEIEKVGIAHGDIIKEDPEHVLGRLENEITKWVCDRNSRSNPINEEWVTKFMDDVENDYKCITNAYYQEFVDGMTVYSNIAIKQERIDTLVKSLAKTRFTLLGFIETNFLRLLQSYHVVKGRKRFTYILSSRLKNRSTNTKFMKALKTSDSNQKDLLILADDGAVNEDESVFDWLLMVPESTKVIVISKNAEELKRKIEKRNIPTELEMESITMADLDLSEDQKREFLQRTILFQGFETKLGDMPALSQLQQHICEAQLDKLIRGEVVQIGCGLPDVKTRCPLYIPRKFGSNISFDSLLKNDKKFKYIKSVEEVVENPSVEYMLVFEDPNQLKILNVDKFVSQTVHVFLKTEKIPTGPIYFQSFGRRPSFYSSFGGYALEELSFIEHARISNSKIILLAGELGTGKSTTWLQLANTIKKNDPSAWVVFISLPDVSTSNKLEAMTNAVSNCFDTDSESSDTDNTDIDSSATDYPDVTEDSVAEFMGKKTVKDVAWDFDYFKTCLKVSPNKMIVFLDGFDEICPSYKTTVLQIINKLVEIGVSLVYVSTRTYLEKELETELSTFVYHLEPLSENEQISIILKLWSAHNYTYTEIEEEYVRKMLEKLKYQIRKRYEFIIGSPLVSLLIGNSPPQKVGDFLNDKLSIYSLYKNFVSQIFKRYCTEKLESNTSQNSNIIEINERKFDFYRKMSLYAMRSICTDDRELNKLLTEEEVKELRELCKKQIEGTTIRELILYPPHFVHQSFAHFFIACFFYYKFQRTANINEFWQSSKKIIFSNKHHLVNTFFFHKVDTKFSKGVSKVYQKVNELLCLCSEDPVRFVCEQNLSNCFKCLLQGTTADTSPFLRYAIKFERFEHIEILIKKGVKMYDLLHAAILQENLKTVQYLVQKGCQLGETNSEGQTLLHTAVQGRNLEIVQELITKSNILNISDNLNYTPTYFAYKCRNFYMTSFLRHHGGLFSGCLLEKLKTSSRSLEHFKPFGKDGSFEDIDLIKQNRLLLFSNFIIETVYNAAFKQQNNTLAVVEETSVHLLVKFGAKYIANVVNYIIDSTCKDYRIELMCLIVESNPDMLESECYFVVACEESNSLKAFNLATLLLSEGVQEPFSVLSENEKAQIVDRLTKSERISHSLAIEFVNRVKLTTDVLKEWEFYHHFFLKLQNKFPFRCPLYTLTRLQCMSANLQTGVEWTGDHAEAVYRQLKLEAYELHCTESMLKYNDFRFKVQAPFIPELENYLRSNAPGTPFIVENTLDSAQAVNYLGTRIHYHIPGWMFVNDSMLDCWQQEAYERNEKFKLVFVHNLDCRSDVTQNCVDCDVVLKRCASHPQWKFIVAMKHHSQGSVMNLDELHYDFIHKLVHYPVTVQANNITLGMLPEFLFKLCVNNGALEHIAQNLPIHLGQQHPIHYDTQGYIISETRPVKEEVESSKTFREEEERSKTFHESLSEILQDKMTFIQDIDDVFIKPNCECNWSLDNPFKKLVRFLACEISWCHKDKCVICIDFEEIHPFLDSAKDDFVFKLLNWYRSIESDVLSQKYIELYLKTRIHDVILIIDAGKIDLKPGLKKYLQLLTNTGFYSILVYFNKNIIEQLVPEEEESRSSVLKPEPEQEDYQNQDQQYEFQHHIKHYWLFEVLETECLSLQEKRTHGFRVCPHLTEEIELMSEWNSDSESESELDWESESESE